MNIVCVICSDRLTPSDDVFYTPCGHIFHFPCVTQWLERSKTCPQCRDKVTQNKIHRLYFNFCNNDTITEDATSLQASVDSLKFQILVKEREAKQSLTKYETSKKEASGLRAEVKKLEHELGHKNTVIHSLKEQSKYFKEQSMEAENAKKEVVRLKKKLDEYRSIQILINAPSEDVDEMIANTTDPAKLLTYISVMKRELTTSVARRKELRTSVKKLQQELTKVSMERNFLATEHEKRKEFEEMLSISESRRNALENRLKELEDGATCEKSKKLQSQKSDGSELPGMDLKDGGACSLKTSSDVIDLCDDSPLLRKSKPAKTSDFELSPSENDLDGNEENSPLSGLKYNISGELPKRKTKLFAGSSAYAILAKKPRLAQTVSLARSSSEMTFDGFGGHSKNEKFPSPKKYKELRKPGRSSIRKPKLDDGNNRKLGDFVNLDP